MTVWKQFVDSTLRKGEFLMEKGAGEDNFIIRRIVEEVREHEEYALSEHSSYDIDRHKAQAYNMIADIVWDLLPVSIQNGRLEERDE